MKKFTSAIFALSLGLVVVSLASAEIRNSGADFLVKVGEQMLHDGDRESAIHEFSKALMIDPQNAGALENLKKLGLKKGLYSGAQTGLSHISELGQSIEEYKQKLAQLEQEKQQMKQRLAFLQSENRDLYQHQLVKQAELDVVEGKKTKISSEAQAKMKEYEDQMQQMRSSYSKEIDVLKKEVSLSGASPSKKEEDIFADYVLAMKARDAELNSLRERLDRTVDRSLDYETQLSLSDDSQAELKKYLTDQHAHHEKLIHILEDYLRLRESDLDDAKDETIDKHISLVSADGMLLHTTDELIHMNDLRDAFVSRLDDREFFVKEKGSYISFLEERVQKAQREIHQKNLMLDEQKEVLSRLHQELKSAQDKIQNLQK